VGGLKEEVSQGNETIPDIEHSAFRGSNTTLQAMFVLPVALHLARVARYSRADAGMRGPVERPALHGGLGTVPKAMDVITPAGVSQADELD
jgi:hypothetical protein